MGVTWGRLEKKERSWLRGGGSTVPEKTLIFGAASHSAWGKRIQSRGVEDDFGRGCARRGREEQTGLNGHHAEKKSAKTERRANPNGEHWVLGGKAYVCISGRGIGAQGGNGNGTKKGHQESAHSQ